MYNPINRVFDLMVATAFVVSIVFAFACNTVSADNEYHKFENYKLFEPSGIAHIPDTKNYLVIDDKDDYVSTFELDGNKLHQISVVPLEIIYEYEDDKGDEIKVKFKKLEGITGFRYDEDHYTAYAITAFDKKEDSRRNRLASISLPKEGEIEIKDVNITNPREFLDKDWIKIEGIAFTEDGNHLLIGVRAIGNKKNPEYRVIILKYELNQSENKAENPKKVVDVDLKGIIGRSEGISSIEYDPNLKKYIVLTSFETGKKESKNVPAIEQVGGHLWLLPVDLKEANNADAWKRYKKIGFTHKPEGVTLTSTPGEVIVVFDDDNDRKCIKDCDGKFKQRPNQGVFKIIDLNSAN